VTHHVIHSDCLVGMRLLDANSIDAVVTDPPYGISFLGCAWDGADIESRTAARRAMPSRDPHTSAVGGHNSVAAQAGKYDLTPKGMSAFQLFSRDWAVEALRVLKPGGHVVSFASPRTHHRMTCGLEEAGFEIRDTLMWVFGSGFPKSLDIGKGWGTALKPAHEPLTLARKPLTGTVAATVRAHGTGGLNIDGCRVPTEEVWCTAGAQAGPGYEGGWGTAPRGSHPGGRWPANFLHDGSEDVAALLGESARFFYCPKASKKDRDEGLSGVVPSQANTHPTVKPTDLMRYLCRLITPPGGTILDPFTGSGSTGKAAKLEGFGFIGFEQDADYVRIARARISGVTV